ncbi:hypothetical protein [Vacuolonema iberomarrocanum]|uniref:hypothetical protein n=1 Tax=Vacuolonema iberomarrocanum TaxID=3454632 RepID=UPI001A0F682C|nr:hypothetical protein [filamentous cyanobacterium LEGE 07170]
MLTQFVSLSVPLQPTPAAMERAIAQSLQAYGEPLRWAITAVDVESQTAAIEAVVTVTTRIA